jgi:hypothetical protein
MPPLPQMMVRAAEQLPKARPARELPAELHLHLHGASAEDLAAIIER